MASVFNDNIQLNSSKAIENKQGKFVSGVWRPYTSIQEVYDTLYIGETPKFVYRGLFVHILIEGICSVYWFRDGILKEHLVPFTSGSITVSSTPVEDGTDAISNGWAFSIDERVTTLEENAGEPTYTLTIPVSLSNNKSLGRYVNEDTISYEDKTLGFILADLAQEALEPTVGLSSSTVIAFNQSAISNVIPLSYTINSLGATLTSAVLEWRRNNTGTWTALTLDTPATGTTYSATQTHSLTDPLQFSGATNAGGTNTQPFNYRFTVTDSMGGTKQQLLNITPQSYVAPTVSSFSIGSTTRELGNINTPSITGTINRNSANVSLTNYKLQYSLNNSTWVDFGSTTAISGASAPISGSHNDIGLVNSTSIFYRPVIVDAYQTFLSSTVSPTSASISFTHKNLLLYDADTTISLSDIDGSSSNLALTNSKARTISGVTAGSGLYTYYTYAASAGDLSNIIQDGATPVLGAFTKLSDLTGTNSFGATVTYRVYKSNATNAFTNNTLAIT